MNATITILLMAGALAAVRHRRRLWGRLPFVVLTPQMERGLGVLPLGIYSLLFALLLPLHREGMLGPVPVVEPAVYAGLPAAAIFYCILLVATRNILASLALSLAVLAMVHMPAPLL